MSGVGPKSRIELKNRMNNYKFKKGNSAAGGILEDYKPSPKRRVISEYELLGALVGNKSEKELKKYKIISQKCAFGNVIAGKNSAKQFGA